MAEKSSPFYVDQLDEIVFSNRNKEYGAYALRRAYRRFVNRSMLFAIVIMLAVVLIPFFIWKQTATAGEETTVTSEMMDMATNKKEDAPPPPPPPPEQVMEQKAKFTAPVVTMDTTEVVEISQDDLNQSTVNVNVSTDDVVVEDDGSDDIIEEVIATPVFTVVEEMPSFPGDDESRVRLLTENIKYPQMAKESGIQGTVYVTFVIDERGRVADVKVLRGIGGGCDEEAIRVVKMMPPWNAGKQSGKPVRVQFNMPIKFTLN